jgi:hypothetical protein
MTRVDSQASTKIPVTTEKTASGRVSGGGGGIPSGPGGRAVPGIWVSKVMISAPVDVAAKIRAPTSSLLMWNGRSVMAPSLRTRSPRRDIDLRQRHPVRRRRESLR